MRIVNSSTVRATQFFTTPVSTAPVSTARGQSKPVAARQGVLTLNASVGLRCTAFCVVMVALVALASDVATAQPEKKLPWNEGGEEDKRLPPRKLIHPSELLELFGIAESQLKMLTDGEPVGAGDEETLVRILYQLPRFPLDALQRWAAPSFEIAPLVAEPEKHRGDAVRLSGHAIHLRKQSLPPESVARFEFSDYFVVTIESTQPRCRLEVCTRSIPQAWKPGPLDEPVSALGLFLKPGIVAKDANLATDTEADSAQAPDSASEAGSPEDPGDAVATTVPKETPSLVFATPRVAWHPDRIQPANDVAADHVALSRLGMDIGLFDAVRNRNRKGIEHTDSECFYQLLAAVGRAAPGELAKIAKRDPPFGPLLQSPQVNQGKIFSLHGTARRVSKILVGEKDLQERFGFNEYYQIDIFVPLGNQVVRLGDATSNEEVPTFEHEYPITVCVRELPPTLRVGDDLRQEVRVAAVYFKLWSYRSEYISSFDDRQLQIGPLLIGRSLSVIEVKSTRNPWIGVIAGFMFLVVLGITWFGLWRSGRTDRKIDQASGRRRDRLRDAKSLDEIDAPDGPDFSNLG